MTTEEHLRASPSDSTAPSSVREAKTEPRIAIARSLGVIISLIAIVVCGYLLFNLFKDTVEIPLPGLTEQQEASPAQAEPLTTALNENPLTTGVETTDETASKLIQPPLPELNKSDTEIREAALQLNDALKWAKWITTDEAIRKFVVVIDNLATGKITQKYLPIPKPEHKFSSTQNGIKVYIDDASFKRYSPYVSLFENIDNDMAVALYQRYSPLMEQAFSELGYGDRTFHDTLMKAFDVLLSAPVVEANIELVRPSVFYKFANPDLEGASPAHKQLIRMGPENTRKLQGKIRQLQALLGR